MIYPPHSETDSAKSNALSWDYAPGMGGPVQGEHTFEADTIPIPIQLRRPPPEQTSQTPLAQVTVNLVVDSAGKVRSAKAEGNIEGSISYTDGWKFIPAFKQNKPVATYLKIGVVPLR
jgi:hypothetical protein